MLEQTRKLVLTSTKWSIFGSRALYTTVMARRLTSGTSFVAPQTFTPTCVSIGARVIRSNLRLGRKLTLPGGLPAKSMELPSYRHFIAIPILQILRLVCGAETNLQFKGPRIRHLLHSLCWNTEGQDVAEYAIMLAVVLVIVMGVVRMIGSNASTVFSQVGSVIQ